MLRRFMNQAQYLIFYYLNNLTLFLCKFIRVSTKFLLDFFVQIINQAKHIRHGLFFLVFAFKVFEGNIVKAPDW